MYRLSLLITAILLISIATGAQETQAQDRMTAHKLSTYASTFSYAAMPYDANNAPQKQEWKLVGPYPKPVSGVGYITRPYHNPNLIQENEEQRAMQQQQAREQARIQAIQQANQLNSMCEFSFAARRRRNGYMQGGPAVITPYKVYSRQVVSQAEYRNACTKYYQDNRIITND